MTLDTSEDREGVVENACCDTSEDVGVHGTKWGITHASEEGGTGLTDEGEHGGSS
jgi:hypothetical protein